MTQQAKTLRAKWETPEQRAPKYIEQQRFKKTKQWAEVLVHEAMLQGLEWAIRSPRMFTNDAMMTRGYPGGGADLTDVECKAIQEVSKRLRDRLENSKGLWRANGTPKHMRAHRMTDEEMAAQAEAEAIALGARPRR